MTVAALLSTKPGDVRTIHPWSTVTDAVRRLGETPRVGALVVVSDRGRVIGLVGEREIVRGLGDHGPALMQLSAENVMSRNIPTCGLSDSLGSVMRTMTESRFRHIPVMDGNELVGLVSIGDVVRARLKDTEMEAAVLRDIVKLRS